MGMDPLTGYFIAVSIYMVVGMGIAGVIGYAFWHKDRHDHDSTVDEKTDHRHAT